MIERILRDLRARLDASLTRAVITRVNDALKTQRLQLTVLADEPVPNVEHFQPYGLSFAPPSGAEAIALALSGARSHTVAICAQYPDDRPKNCPPRTGGLYTRGQWRVYIDENGIVHAGAKVGEDFPALAQRVLDELNDIRDKFDSHTHVVNVTGSSSAQSGTSNAPSSTMGAAGSVAASKVKVT